MPIQKRTSNDIIINITYHLYLITKAYNVLVTLVLRMSKQAN